jgi:hypothetical protein
MRRGGAKKWQNRQIERRSRADMGTLPPATAWLSDALAPPPLGGAASWQAPAAPSGPTVPQLAQVVDKALAADDERVGDLSKLLFADAGQTSAYSPHPAGVRNRPAACMPTAAAPPARA